MNLKEVKHRILSIKSTQKITSAMKLVSSAKLRRAQSAVEGMRPYKRRLDGMLRTLLAQSRGTVSGSMSMYTTARDVKRVVLIAVASDTGLCGTFNSNVVRLMNAAVEEYRAKGADVSVIAVGSKMCDAVKKHGLQPDARISSEAGAPDYNAVAQIAVELISRFTGGDVDKVELVYTRFESMSRHIPVREQFLPFATSDEEHPDDVVHDDLIVEPDREALLASLLPKVISLDLYASLLESAVSEHAARMVAMQLATDNADELIAALTLEYNKGRQQAITSEILDIVGGGSHEE